MLATSDKNGEVQASIPGLARIAGVSIENCEKAIRVFMSPDKHSRTKDDEGRRIIEIDGGWALLNHAKYRAMASKEDAQQSNAERQRRFQERKLRNAKPNAEVTANNATVTDANAEVTQDKDIADTYSNTYPLKEDRESTESSKDASLSLSVKIFEAWNEMAKKANLPQCIAVSDKRKKSLEVRLKDAFFAQHWSAALAKIPASPFLAGCSERGWKASFDWFISRDAVIKIIEGKYDSAPEKPAAKPFSQPYKPPFQQMPPSNKGGNL